MGSRWALLGSQLGQALGQGLANRFQPQIQLNQAKRFYDLAQKKGFTANDLGALGLLPGIGKGGGVSYGDQLTAQLLQAVLPNFVAPQQQSSQPSGGYLGTLNGGAFNKTAVPSATPDPTSPTSVAPYPNGISSIVNGSNPGQSIPLSSQAYIDDNGKPVFIDTGSGIITLMKDHNFYDSNGKLVGSAQSLGVTVK